MTEELVRQEERPLSAGQIRSQVNLVQEVMKAVMQEGQHYGKIPGCGDKPTLLKPGAEKLMMTFRLSADPIVEEIPTEDGMTFRVVCRMMHQTTGINMGSGIGEASTKEDKWNWRGTVSDAEWNATPEDRRRIKYTRNGEIKQVRTNPADLANTVLKMAKKRALVDGILTVTGASDIFTQDIEEIPAEYLGNRQSSSSKPSVQPPQSKSQPQQVKEIVGLVEGVTFKDGKTGNKPWTLFTIKIAGIAATTFDKKHAEYAKEAKEIEQPVKIEYTEGERGNTLISIIVAETQEPGAGDE